LGIVNGNAAVMFSTLTFTIALSKKAINMLLGLIYVAAEVRDERKKICPMKTIIFKPVWEVSSLTSSQCMAWGSGFESLELSNIAVPANPTSFIGYRG